MMIKLIKLAKDFCVITVALIFFTFIVSSDNVSFAAQKSLSVTRILSAAAIDQTRAGRVAVGDVDNVFDYRTINPIPENSLIVAGNVGIGTLVDDVNSGISSEYYKVRLTVNGGILRAMEAADPNDATYVSAPSEMLGANSDTHVNLGVGSITGKDAPGPDPDMDPHFCTVGGGFRNEATGEAATVGGGYRNVASGNYSTIGGGSNNQAAGGYSTVGGGENNVASGNFSTVIGGLDNTASGTCATVLGGRNNTASGKFSTVPGGEDNIAAGDYSWAGGKNMQLTATADRTFVWGYSDDAVTITTPDAFIIYGTAANPVRVGIGTVNPNAPTSGRPASLHVMGDIYCTGDPIPEADYVFEPDYNLESIEEHARLMWERKRLPAMPHVEKTEDGDATIEIGQDRRGIVEELEKAHIYVAQLKEKLDEQKKRIAILGKSLGEGDIE